MTECRSLPAICSIQSGFEQAMQWLQTGLLILTGIAVVVAFLLSIILLRNAFGERGVWAGLVGWGTGAGIVLGRMWARQGQKNGIVVKPIEQTDDQIRAIQLALASRGLYDGAFDGIYGIKTHSGVNAVERSLGLRPTPYNEKIVKLDPRVLVALGLR